MKKLAILAFVLLLTSGLFAQEKLVGEVFTAEKANELFGKVVESKTMDTDNLLNIVMQTDDKVMFRLEDGDLIIAGDSRKVLLPANGEVEETTVLNMYSKIRLLEMIASGRKDEVVIQMREVTTTIENGTFVLERGYPCPPYCE